MRKYLTAFVSVLGLGSFWTCFAAGELPTVDSFTNAFERQCFVFAQDFCERARRGTITSGEVFDADALIARSLKNSDCSPRWQEILLPRFKEFYGSVFISQFDSVRNLRLVKLRRDRMEARAVLRVINQDGSLTYIELLCAARPGGRIRVVDVFNWSSGELASDSLRRSIVSMQKLNPVQKLTRKEESNVILAAALKDMTHLVKTRQWGATLQCYAQLPADLQREKFFAMLRMKAAVRTDEKEYSEALRFLQKNFPNDPVLDLVAYDAIYFQGKYDNALQVVDKLDRSIGGDPFLDLVRSELYQKLGQADPANDRRNEALRRDPKLAELIGSQKGMPILSDRRPVQVSSTSAGRTGTKSGMRDMKLQGVFLRNARPTAMINGKDVREGDTFEGMQIVKIEQTQVTLQATNGELRSLTFD